MKATYHDFLTKESEKKLGNIGSRNGPRITYTKDDFLTPNKVAKHFGIPTEKAKNIMKDLIFKRAAFGLNGRKSQIVVKMGKDHSMYVHPMALDAFKQYLDQQKD